jgi:hypothetical protein
MIASKHLKYNTAGIKASVGKGMKIFRVSHQAR